MRETIIEMAAAMRRCGWPVSTSELVDCFKALPLVGFSREDAFAAALCTLCKDKQSRDYLAELFDDRLHQNTQANKFIPRSLDVKALLADPPHLPDGLFASRLDEIKNSIRQEVMSRPITTRPGRGHRGARSGMGFGNGAENEFAAASSNPVAPPKTGLAKPAAANLRYLDLAAANSEQLDEIKGILGALGKKLAVKRGYRKKPALRGTVNMRGTVRNAISHGGVPLVLKKEQRVPSSPVIVVLCDLSGSVAPYSEFFLQLLSGLRNRFRDLRCFAFVDQVQEVTGMFKSPGDAWSVTARKIIRNAQISITGFSNYGRVWEYFNNHYRHILTPDTTLIILGDARNNWQPDGANILKSITGLCRRTLWLNPLPYDNWVQNDCVMDVYAPCCTSAHECRNALQLSRVIREIITS